MTKFSEFALMGQVQMGTVGFSSQPVEKSLTFTGGDNAGTIGTVDMFRVEGEALVRVFATSGSSLTSTGTPTVELGFTGDTAGLLAQAGAKTFTAGAIYHTSGVGDKTTSSGSLTSFVVSTGTIILTVGTAKVTGGTAKFMLSYVPLSDGSTVVAL